MDAGKPMLDAGQGHLAARFRFLCWNGRLASSIDGCDGCGNGSMTLSDAGGTLPVQCGCRWHFGDRGSMKVAPHRDLHGDVVASLRTLAGDLSGCSGT